MLLISKEHFYVVTDGTIHKNHQKNINGVRPVIKVQYNKTWLATSTVGDGKICCMNEQKL